MSRGTFLKGIDGFPVGVLLSHRRVWWRGRRDAFALSIKSILPPLRGRWLDQSRAIYCFVAARAFQRPRSGTSTAVLTRSCVWWSCIP